MTAAGRRKPGEREAQHLQLAPRHAGVGERIGEQCRQIVAGADDDRPGADGPGRRLDPARADRMDGDLAAEDDAVMAGQPRGERRDRAARIDPQVDRAPQCPRQRRRGQWPDPRRRRRGVEPRAPRRHVGVEERLQHRRRFGPLRDDGEPGMFDRDPRRGGDFGPDVARPPRPRPHLARFLTGDGDEAEVADRRAVGLRIAVDDDAAQAAARRGERMGEADDARPDDRDIVRLFAHAVSALSRAAGPSPGPATPPKSFGKCRP